MTSLLMRRLIAGLAVVFGVVALTFALLHLAPGDPVERLLGPSASAEQLHEQREALGLDRPIPAQFAEWVGRFVRGDWGRSISSGRSVSRMLGEAWPATVLLVSLSLAGSYLIGILIGVLQAARGGTRLDTTLSVTTVTMFAMPSYWLGLMLVMLFTYTLGWLPAFGASGLDADFLSGWERVVDRLRHLALPLFTLTLIGVGGIARFVRGSMLDVRDEPYVAIARSKGLGASRVLWRHIFRNALIPVVTLLGLSLPALFSGAVFVEVIFAWPGVGRLLVEAVQARDYPVVMAATAVSAILVVAGNLLADLLVSRVDPRVRDAHA
ncbi:MAG: ABC transporter permease [Gemmatimonadales bacterium]